MSASSASRSRRWRSRSAAAAAWRISKASSSACCACRKVGQPSWGSMQAAEGSQASCVQEAAYWLTAITAPALCSSHSKEQQHPTSASRTAASASLCSAVRSCRSACTSSRPMPSLRLMSRRAVGGTLPPLAGAAASREASASSGTAGAVGGWDGPTVAAPLLPLSRRAGGGPSAGPVIAA